MNQRALCILFVLVQLALVVVTCQLLVVPCLVLCILFWAASLEHRNSHSQLQWAAYVGGVFLTVFVVRLAFPYQAEPRNWLVPPWIALGLIEWLLIVQVSEFACAPSPRKLPLHFPGWGLWLLVMSYNQFAPTKFNHVLLFTALACVGLAALIFQAHRSESLRRQSGAHHGSGAASSNRRWILAGLFVVMTVMSWQAYETLAMQPEQFFVRVIEQQRQYWGFDEPPRVYIYQRSGTLTAVHEEKHTAPNQIALRVFSKYKPGYLRGAAYATFIPHPKGGRWYKDDSAVPVLSPLSVADETPEMPLGVRESLQKTLSGADAVFRIMEGEPVGETWSLRIINDPMRGEMYFTPLGVQYAQGRIYDQFRVDRHQEITLGFSTSHPYTVYTTTDSAQTTPGSGSQPNSLTTKFASPHTAEIRKLALELAGNFETDAEKIAAVETFFHDTFETSEVTPGVPLKAGMHPDPISDFILERQPAHAEYFATGDIALLRELGIPSRYVTMS